MAKILIVDDNVDLVFTVEDALVAENYLVEKVYSGQDGLDRLKHYEYDAVILDWNLPVVSGVDILKQFRAQGKKTPVLMLTGKTDVDEKELGLDAGADDYLTKPFELGELRARLRALLRRASGSHTSILKIRDLELNHITQKLTKSGDELSLLPGEFALMEFFMRHPNKVFSAESLLNHVWVSGSDATPEAFRTCLMRLRKKVDADGSLIKTVHGVGYKMTP